MNKQIDLFRLSSIIKGNAKNIKTSCELRTQVKMTRGRKDICVYMYTYNKRREKYEKS